MEIVINHCETGWGRVRHPRDRNGIALLPEPHSRLRWRSARQRVDDLAPVASCCCACRRHRAERPERDVTPRKRTSPQARKLDSLHLRCRSRWAVPDEAQCAPTTSRRQARRLPGGREGLHAVRVAFAKSSAARRSSPRRLNGLQSTRVALSLSRRGRGAHQHCADDAALDAPGRARPGRRRSRSGVERAPGR